MTNYIRSSWISAAVVTAVLLAGSFAPLARAATPSEPAKPDPPPAKPMIKKEPMAGEMKKDGMMKEDVSKAAKQWSEKMDEMMKKEKMK